MNKIEEKSVMLKDKIAKVDEILNSGDKCDNAKESNDTENSASWNKGWGKYGKT